MFKLVSQTHPALRAKSKDVPTPAIKTPKIKTLIKDMKRALEKEPDGVAIAAPQVGQALRIFIVSKKVFEAQDRKDGGISPTPPKFKDRVFINPKITKRSKKVAALDEGCLSVRNTYGKVKRAEKATVSAQDENGKQFTLGGSGLLAQVFQHECDHLEGVLFIDKALSLEKAPAQNASK